MSTTIAAPPSGSSPAPGDLTARQWAARYAALVGRGADADDPRVLACRAALAFHRVRTVIRRERDHLDPADATALQEALTMT